MLPLLFALNSAEAADLAYTWPVGEPMHYRIQVAIDMPYMISIIGSENTNARLGGIGMVWLVECTAEAPEKKTQDMNCDIVRTEIAGSGLTREQDQVDLIMEEYDRLLEGSTVQIEWSQNGRIKNLDLEGPPKTTKNENTVHETLRLFTTRAFSALEVEMPKDPAATNWKQKGSPTALRLMTMEGTSGGVRMFHEVTGEEDGLVVITTVGDATVQDGSSADDDSTTQTVSLMLSGQAKFDPERGLLVENFQAVQGMMTASAGQLGSGMVLNQSVMVDLLPGFEEVMVEMDAALNQKEEAKEAAKETLSFDEDISGPIQLDDAEEAPAEAPAEDEAAEEETPEDAAEPTEGE